MTMAHTTPPEAHATLQRHAETIYLDVRDSGLPVEAGHGSGAGYAELAAKR